MKRLVIAALCALACTACKKQENKAEPTPAPGSAVTGSAAPGSAAAGSAAAGSAAPGSAAPGSAAAGSADAGDACMKECMAYGPEGKGSPFVEDWKKKSKDEQEGACSAACADANMPAD